MAKFFKKFKTPFLAHLCPLCPFLGKNRIFLKIMFLPIFLILTKYHCATFQKYPKEQIPSTTGSRRIHQWTSMSLWDPSD